MKKLQFNKKSSLAATSNSLRYKPLNHFSITRFSKEINNDVEHNKCTYLQQ